VPLVERGHLLVEVCGFHGMDGCARAGMWRVKFSAGVCRLGKEDRLRLRLGGALALEEDLVLLDGIVSLGFGW